jgi:hypothetical protein
MSGELRSPSKRRLVIRSSALVGVLVAATVTAVIVARHARTPNQRAAEAAPPKPSVVTAEVSQGSLVAQQLLTGHLTRTDEVTVSAPTSVAGASAVVVTKMPLSVGQITTPGTVLAEVSGRPLIVLRGAFRNYRDLSRGDTGADVAQLQTALDDLAPLNVTGVIDWQTEQAVRNLYKHAGYTPLTTDVAATTADSNPPANTSPPGGNPAATAKQLLIPAGELVYLPQRHATVSDVAATVGQVTPSALLSLVSGGWRVDTSVDDKTAALLRRLPKGATVHFGPGPLSGQATRLLGIIETTSTAAPTNPPITGPPQADGSALLTARFAVDKPPRGGGTDQQVIVESKRSPKDSLIVPVSALWTVDSGKVSVTVVRADAEATVDVDVLLSVDGRAAVVATRGTLNSRDKVVIAYRSDS